MGVEKALNSEKRHRTGIRVGVLSIALFCAAILCVAFFLFELTRGIQYAQSLYSLEQDRQKCDHAIQRFMDGSDYLTAEVQQFVITADRAYMDNYWAEVYETQSRDKALDDILATNISPEEYRVALNSKAESDSLINGEIRAMRLVCESVNIDVADMPADVAAHTLSEADAKLSAQQKQETAVAYIFGPDYSTAKDVIRGHVNDFRNEISNRYGIEALDALNSTTANTHFMALCLVAFSALLVATVLCFQSQIVNPLVRFSKKLAAHKAGAPIELSDTGAMEIRLFAAEFNALYAQVEQNTKRLERLGYIDYLTDVPNRASVNEYVESVIREGGHDLGFMIIDIDNFKHFNDTYGHALGDKVLKRVAAAVCVVQPDEHGISGRICGEEFVVAIRDASESELRATAEAILDNVRGITAKDVGLSDDPNFRITVSVGGMIWRGERPADAIALLSKADKALYTSKQTGKDKYTFSGAVAH